MVRTTSLPSTIITAPGAVTFGKRTYVRADSMRLIDTRLKRQQDYPENGQERRA